MTARKKTFILSFLAMTLLYAFLPGAGQAQMDFGNFKLEPGLLETLDKDIQLWVFKKYSNFKLLWVQQSDSNDDIGLIFSADKEEGAFPHVLISFVYRKTQDGWWTYSGAEMPSVSDVDMKRLTAHVENVLSGQGRQTP